MSLIVHTSAGVPIQFVRNNRTWNIVESVRWFERVSWWETVTRRPGAVDVEVWQVQARIGQNPRTPLVTFELVLGLDRATWSERSMDVAA